MRIGQRSAAEMGCRVAVIHSGEIHSGEIQLQPNTLRLDPFGSIQSVRRRALAYHYNKRPNLKATEADQLL